jgi:molybdopterin converting factor subunit 1
MSGVILFFGRLRDSLGGQMSPLPGERSVRELRELLSERHPDAAPLLLSREVRVAVNRQLVHDESARVRAEDEVAFMPPLSGG